MPDEKGKAARGAVSTLQVHRSEHGSQERMRCSCKMRAAATERCSFQQLTRAGGNSRQPRTGAGATTFGPGPKLKWVDQLPKVAADAARWVRLEGEQAERGNQGHSREDQGRAGHRSETGSWHDRVGHWATKKRTEMPPA